MSENVKPKCPRCGRDSVEAGNEHFAGFDASGRIIWTCQEASE